MPVLHAHLPRARLRCLRVQYCPGRLRVAVKCAPTAEACRLEPVTAEASAWAPATVANLGPGFDWMGCAVNVRISSLEPCACLSKMQAHLICSPFACCSCQRHGRDHVQGDGDTVTAIADEAAEPGSITIESIEGDGGRLSLTADDNCVGIAARETLALSKHNPSCGIRLRLVKGLPLGSGMGSSAASAAAACWAVNALFGKPLTKQELVYAGLQSEAFVSGYHADNIAPALLGGFVLVRCAVLACVAQTIFDIKLASAPSRPQCAYRASSHEECSTARVRGAYAGLPSR